MGKVRTIQSALNGGEISPKLRGQTGIPRYQHGLEFCRNAIPMIWGGARRIGGTRYIGEAADYVRLIDFPIAINGVLTGYTLEFSNLKLRFLLNDELIKNAGVPYSVATPYTTADLDAIRYDSSANVLYLFHPNHHPMRLIRNYSDTNWTLQSPSFTEPTLRPPNTGGFVITPSATSGVITLSCSSGFFEAGHVGAYIYLNGGACQINSVSDPQHATATVTVGIGGGGTANERIDTLTVNYAGEYYSIGEVAGTNYGPFVTNINVTADFVNQSLTCTPDSPLPAGLSISKVTTTNVLANASSDPNWKESAWSDLRGWPACGTFHNQRLVLGGTPTYPTYQFGSKSGDPLDFTVGTLDNAGFAFNLADISTSIFHMVGLDSLTIFAGDRELTERGGNDTPLTPTNMQVKTRTPHGSSLTRPVHIGGDIYFVPPSQRKLRGLVYQFANDKFEADDLAIIADHLAEFGGGFKQLVSVREPYNLLYIITNNGPLLTLTLDKEQQVTAWACHGDDMTKYISAASTPGPNGVDQVTFAVQRLIGGVWKTSLEQLDSSLQTNCTVVATGSNLMEITGLDHLEGRQVDIKADGFYCGRVVVSGGKVALDNGAARIEAGLPYRTIIKDLPLELANPGQTAQETNISISKIHVRLHESQGCMVNGEQIPFRSFPNINDPVAPFTGDKTIQELGRGTEPEKTQVTIEQDLPFDLTVLAIIKEVAING